MSYFSLESANFNCVYLKIDQCDLFPVLLVCITVISFYLLFSIGYEKQSEFQRIQIWEVKTLKNSTSRDTLCYINNLRDSVTQSEEIIFIYASSKAGHCHVTMTSVNDFCV